MLRNLYLIIILLELAGCVVVPVPVEDAGSSYSKTGEVAGTVGLEVAAKKCAPLEGSKDWQLCVAHYDGLYTKVDGIIKRSYALSTDAPKPTGKIEPCYIKAQWNKNTKTWGYTSCELPPANLPNTSSRSSVSGELPQSTAPAATPQAAAPSEAASNASPAELTPSDAAVTPQPETAPN